MRANLYYLTILFLFMLLFCVSCVSQQADIKEIDYESLSVIQHELILEIGDDASNGHLLGSLDNLVVMEDGDLLVSDLGKLTVEQFSQTGEHIATVSKEGRGPGELSSFFSLIKGNPNTLFMKHRGMYRHMDFFQKNSETDIYEYIETAMPEYSADARITYLGAVSDSVFLAQINENHLLPSQYLLEPQAAVESIIVAVDAVENIIKDSLHSLKTPMPVFRREGAAVEFASPSYYQYQEHVKVISNQKYIIAQPEPDKISIDIYQSDHSPSEQLEFFVKPRHMDQAMLDHSLKQVDNSEIRKELEGRIGDYKPSFLDVWISDSYVWLHTDTGGEEKQMVIVSMDGEPAGVFYLSVYDHVEYISDNHVYTLYKNPEGGHTIRVYEVKLPGSH